MSDPERLSERNLDALLRELDVTDDFTYDGFIKQTAAAIRQLRAERDEAMRAHGFLSVQGYHDDYWRVRAERDRLAVQLTRRSTGSGSPPRA
jgi:hypothetical protein